jgi:hypothetical protein
LESTEVIDTNRKRYRTEKTLNFVIFGLHKLLEFCEAENLIADIVEATTLRCTDRIT